MERMLKPWQLSFIIHSSLIGLFLLLTVLKFIPKIETYEVPIVAPPLEAQNLKEVKERPKVVLKSINQPAPENKPVREVFGASRNSYTDSSVADGVEIKKGNTLAKEVDTLKLQDSDADALPTPTEEYLVSDMPVLLSEVRPNYPQEAKEKQLEGVVSLDVLIDEKGSVRQVSVIEGLEIFRAGAVEAMKKFKFKPAKVDGKPVAVRIRYSIKFKLEF
jgi:protein TonB